MSTRNKHQSGGERIKIDRTRPWGSVPESLIEDRRLGPTTRLVAAWLCIRPPGWIVRRTHLLECLGIGLHAWWQARRELIKHKYLIVEQCRTGGRFTTADLEFFPQPELSTALGFTERGASELGSPEPGKPVPLPKTKETLTVETLPPHKNKKAVVVFRKEEEKAVQWPTNPVQWPTNLEKEVIRACMTAVSTSKRPQALADELAGSMLKKSVDNPAAWLRCLVKLDQTGELVLEHAAGVLAARDARAAASERERLAVCQPEKRLPAAAQPTSKVARDQALAAFKKNSTA